MANDPTKEASKVARLYARGILTGQEAITKLVLLAGEFHASDIAAGLPPELLGEVEEVCRIPPASPDESPRIFGIGVGDPEDWRRWTSRLWFEGAWAWHRHFDPEPPSPE